MQPHLDFLFSRDVIPEGKTVVGRYGMRRILTLGANMGACHD